MFVTDRKSKNRVHDTTPLLRSLFHQRVLVGPVVHVPVVILVEIPVVWEVPPSGGLVAVALGAAGFVGFVGLSLVLQDLRNNSTMGLGGDKDLWEDQRACRSSPLFTLVLSDSSRLGSGRRGAWWWW